MLLSLRNWIMMLFGIQVIIEYLAVFTWLETNFSFGLQLRLTLLKDSWSEAFTEGCSGSIICLKLGVSILVEINRIKFD